MKPRYAARTYVPPVSPYFPELYTYVRYFILQVIMEPAGSSGKKAKTAKGSSVPTSDKVYTGRPQPALVLCLRLSYCTYNTYP